MLRIPAMAVIAITRLAALLVAVFCGFALLEPTIVTGAAEGTWLQTVVRTSVAVMFAAAVGLAALYAVLRHGPENPLRYLAFAVLMLPAFLFLPPLTHSPQWYISLIVMALLFLAALSCLLPNPVQAWAALEPAPRR